MSTVQMVQGCWARGKSACKAGVATWGDASAGTMKAKTCVRQVGADARCMVAAVQGPWARLWLLCVRLLPERLEHGGKCLWQRRDGMSTLQVVEGVALGASRARPWLCTGDAAAGIVKV